MDEIKYTTRSMYNFNKYRSINASKHDKVTILNPAYIGTIETVSRNVNTGTNTGTNKNITFNHLTTIKIKLSINHELYS